MLVFATATARFRNRGFIKLSSKGDYLHHPYNTRSRRSNTPPPLKDTPTAAEAGEPEKKVPLTLYNSIKQAIAARKFWEAKKNDYSRLQLNFAEKFVNRIADCYKRKNLLSPNWKYDPAIASTHEPKDAFPSMLLQNGKPIVREDGSYRDSYICIISSKPEVDFVPLKDYERTSWEEFKELAERNFSSIQGDGWGKNFPLSTEHPFVNVIGDFAVNGFNVSFETYVEKGNHKRLTDPTVKNCKYNKMDDLYTFKMIIVCDEDGFRGIYEAVVICTEDDCQKTLGRLALIGIENGRRRHASRFKTSHAGVGLWLPDIERTGMCRRSPMYGLTYGCYDYHDPNDIVG
uniref:uncharacterized protein LOC122606166 isoform X2 n=1 Tax=Erigeron canadensis TaxID=72917 RepID=UPI001CB8B899|nr:uncharacterized protein LOC122606166 isoform X2 [Erigeron canadensis]